MTNHTTRAVGILFATLMVLGCALASPAVLNSTSTAVPRATGTAAPSPLPSTSPTAQAGSPAALPTATPPAQTIKIMPLGDSITAGWPGLAYGGYRRRLGLLLTGDGYHIDFVGSLQIGAGVMPDPDNEGHYGWNITQIKAGIDTRGWLETYQPDLVLLHIGTNDLHEPDPAAAPDRLSALLDDILGRLPRVKVIVAQIIPYRPGMDPLHQAYNAAIPGLVAARRE